ncbi:MAG: Sporulation kinase E [Syntrophorhabdaceae bacterium PtaU1.Bin034]|nr:MAG: Sporulation kinase E [Syntrophorhabdaceae bacterium PtaU1.Bin034]
MPLASILRKHHHRIVDEWVLRLHESVSERYGQRPLSELFVTVTRANEANYSVLVDSNYSLIDEHIKWITRIRLEGGFSLSEVQNAYELYRVVLVPIILRHLRGTEQVNTMQKLNECLFYTITRFSNYFQSLHEEQIRAHAGSLEKEVEKRTRELAESESKYRVLVEEISDGYFVNQNGRIVFANQAFCDLHGYTLEEMVGKAYTEIIAPRSLPAVQKLYEKRMAGEDSKDLYIYLRLDKNHNSLPTENKVKRIIYQGEHAVAGICRDITERMATEKRIREAERFAHIGKLTTSLAHEIRNPLCAVKMNSQILLKNAGFDGNDKRRMEIVVNEISRLERILDEMLDFAKPLTLQMKRCSIREILDSCLETMDVRLKAKEISVKRRYARRRLPRLLLDPEKIEQAVINILINSIDALSTGGRIEISARPVRGNRDYLAVEITDTGPGISAEDLRYVFDPFFSSKKKGTGLGLANVKKIMEAHGGRVGVSSKKPTGTLVSLTLPVKEEIV